MEAKHNVTPVTLPVRCTTHCRLVDADGRTLALLDDDEIAAFIARACNAHDELLGALRFILAFYEPGQTHLDTNAWKQAEASARAAIAKATGSAA